MSSNARIVVGIDGCRNGQWVAVSRRPRAKSFGVDVLGSAAEILDVFPAAAVIGIDIPIGLSDAHPREADIAARQLLKWPRSSSVFPTPIRPILGARTREEASRLNRAADGRGYGAQALAILPRIRDWDDTLQVRRDRIATVFEVHPEVAFCALNRMQAIVASKKSLEGATHRRRLLDVAFGHARVGQVLESERRRDAADDDVLDALAVLWSALRIAAGKARSLPSAIPSDSAGIPMAIHY